MRCSDIHKHDCQVELGDDWKFCPRCGRKAGAVVVQARELLYPFAHSLPVRHRGQQEMRCDFKLDPAGAPEAQALRIADKPKSVRAGQMTGVHFSWNGKPPPVAPPLRVPLRVRSDDGTPQDPFASDASLSRLREWSVLLSLASPRPGKLRLEQEVAVFHPRCRERALRIFNDGDKPLSLHPLEAPPGYALEAASDGAAEQAWIIAPRSARCWMLRALPSAPPGESSLSVWSADHRQQAQVRLLRQAEEKVEAATSYIIGVDFGTSGTSVWVRSGKDPQAPAFALHDPSARDDEYKQRFPTEIFIRLENGVEAKDGFAIGYEARRRSETETGRGLLVRDLKTMLRGEEEPFVRDYGPRYTIDHLLRRYLEALKKKIIDPALGDAGATIAWNFSVPVLDGHQGGAHVMFERQKSRLEKAVRAAGFVTTGCSLQFFTEPFCAAVYLLHGHGLYRFPAGPPPQEGDWACVFDSGGGTTDVVLGQLHYEDGRLQFEEITTLGGYRSDPHSQDVSTFGGEALTRRTALYLTVRHDYLKFSEAVPSDKLYEKMLATAKERGQKAIEEEPVWKDNVPLLSEADGFKRQVARLPAPGSSARIVVKNRKIGDHKISFKRAEFDEQVVNIPLQPLQTEMDRSVFRIADHAADTSGIQDGSTLPLPAEVRWVFGVGGNCRVRRIGEDWLLGYFNDGVQDLETTDAAGQVRDDDRMLAVSGGTVWAAEARRAGLIPYALWVQDENGERIFATHANEVFSDQTRYPECNRKIPPGQSARFEVWIEGHIAAEEAVPFRGRVGSFSLDNHDSAADEGRTLSAFFAFRGRKLIIEAQETPAQRTPKFEYLV